MSATDRLRLGHVEAMDAEPIQSLEHDAALAQEVVRDHRLRHVGELVRRAPPPPAAGSSRAG